MSAVNTLGERSRPPILAGDLMNAHRWRQDLKDVGDQALMRGLDTAFPVVRLGQSLSYCGRRPMAGHKAFGDWVLRIAERELADKEGRSIPFSPGEYNLLLAFVTHPRRVLTRDELLDLTQHRERGAFASTITSAA